MVKSIERWLGTDMATKVMLGITLLLVLTTMILAGLTIPDIASNTESGRRTDDLAACRAQYLAPVNEATVLVFDTYGQVQDALGDAVVASIRQDPTALALIAADIEQAVRTRQEAIALLYEASAIYDDATHLSSENPDEFLANCRENQQ